MRALHRVQGWQHPITVLPETQFYFRRLYEGRFLPEEPTEGALTRLAESNVVFRSVLANMVTGVTKGFERVVLIEGVGYGAAVQGQNLVLNMGFAQPVTMQIPDGVQLEMPSPQRVIFSGADKQLVNDFAAQVRLVRTADPYHQKGMRYEGEVVRRKVGKAFAAGPV